MTEKQNRADIKAVYLGETVLVDVVVTHPVTRQHKNRAVTPRVAADASSKLKDVRLARDPPGVSCRAERAPCGRQPRCRAS